MTQTVHRPGIESLVDLFDTFVLDQFGVLHDGATPYPGVFECLSAMRAAGKKIIILSNSGKRAAENERRMAQLGFDPQSWDVFMSSGEAAWRMFAGGADFKPGMKCFLISRDNDRSAVDGLGLELVRGAADADVILITASEGDRLELDRYRNMLAGAAKSAVRCVCTNPDKIMLTRKGPRFGAGRIAELYEEMGGKVTWIGKPFPAIYDAALAAMGNPPRERALCIGDSPEHDIAGAKSAGLASALVRTGIHAGLSDNELQALCVQHNAAPDFILPGLVWR
jgi:HAD superfamily hydrolase (TIGR01459 family)